MAEMKTLNGYEIVDAKARKDIAKLQENSGSGDIDLSGYATKKELEEVKSHSDTNLNTAKTYTDTVVAQKTQIQIITWEADD